MIFLDPLSGHTVTAIQVQVAAICNDHCLQIEDLCHCRSLGLTWEQQTQRWLLWKEASPQLSQMRREHAQRRLWLHLQRQETGLWDRWIGPGYCTPLLAVEGFQTHSLLDMQIAKRQGVVNPENTFFSVKRFIGRKMNEVKEESKQVPYRVSSPSYRSCWRIYWRIYWGLREAERSNLQSG